MSEWVIMHSGTKGMEWKEHKYIKKIGNRYFYKKENGDIVSDKEDVDETEHKTFGGRQEDLKDLYVVDPTDNTKSAGQLKKSNQSNKGTKTFYENRNTGEKMTEEQVTANAVYNKLRKKVSSIKKYAAAGKAWLKGS